MIEAHTASILDADVNHFSADNIFEIVENGNRIVTRSRELTGACSIH
jgi:hypothetical protein